MTDNTEPTIDKIIDELLAEAIEKAITEWAGQEYPNDATFYDVTVKEAKQAIKALIAQEIRIATDRAFDKFNKATLIGEKKARIDERSQAQQYLHGLTITPESQHLFDVLSRDNHNRIATLKGVKNKWLNPT